MTVPLMLDTLAVQLGWQVAFETAVVATAKLMSVNDLKLEPKSSVKRLRGRRGSYAPAFKAVMTQLGAEGSLEQFGTYEEILYPLEGLFGTVAPVGAGPYVRDYVAPLDTKVTPRIATLMYGSTGNIGKATGLVPVKFNLSLKPDDVATIKTDFIACKHTLDGAFAVIADSTVTPISMDHLSVWVDPAAGPVGTTALTSLVLGVELEIDPQRKAKYGGGSKFAKRTQDLPWDVTLKLTLDYDAVSELYISGALAGTPVEKLIRVKLTDGTGIIQFDMAGVCEEIPPMFTDDDGSGTVEVEFKGTYNASLANYLKVSSTSSKATI